MAKQRKHCEASIARVYSEHVQTAPLFKRPPPISLLTCCTETRNDKHYINTSPVVSARLNRLIADEYNGAHVDLNLWTIHKRVTIGGTRFTAGNSIRGVKRRNEKMNRCGSVVTILSGGRSLYAWVIRFLRYDRLHVAHVSWLPTPDYPTGSPMIVRLMRDGPKPRLPCIVPLIDIDPTHVVVLHEQTCMYMMRLNGIDTMPQT